MLEHPRRRNARLDIHKKIWYGSIWAVSMRWSMRLAGLASVIVLARLLRPEDFGILAMASLLIGALSNFTAVGVGALLIREADISKDDLDTAWTIGIVQGTMLAALVAALAHPTALYFREPRLTDVIYVCALAIFIGSFGNVGMVLVRKELDFAKDFRYHLILRFVGAVITIGLAFWLRSYWALALARPVSAVTGVAISYLMHPYRPWFSMKQARRFYRFSVFVVVSNIARFISSKADVFVIGSTSNATQMGIYNVAADASSIPPKEISVSVGRAMFPSLSKLKHEGGSSLDMKSTFLQVIASVALLCLPIGLGLWAVATDFVRVVLGERWMEAAGLMGYLAIYGMLTSLVNIMLGHVLIVTGHEYRQAAAWWIRAILLVVCVLIGVQFGMTGVAIGATASGVVMFFIAIAILKATIACHVSDFVRIYWRPMLASLVMAATVHYAAQAMAVSAPLRLALSVSLGVVTYTVVLLLLWLAAGRPAGAEAAALSALLRRPVAKVR